MSVFIICVSIVILATIVYLVISYNIGSNTILSTKSLNELNAKIPVKDQPNSSRSAIGVWIYVTSWNKLLEKEILLFPGKYRLYLEDKSPVLYAEIFTTDGTQKIKITQNFPIQKWTYITLNLDNSFIDCYINGKLIKSIQLNNPQANSTDPSIFVGGNPPVAHDIILNNLKRWLQPQTPQSIYNEYLRGNGNYFFSNSFASYGLQLNLLKNNITNGTLVFF